MTDSAALVGTAVMATIGAAGTVVVAQVSTIDPWTALAGVATQGVLGCIAAWLLWRQREVQREHAAERARDAEQRNARDDKMLETQAQIRELLAAIRTQLERR